MPIADASLWEAVQAGDQAAFGALYARYWRRVFLAAYARLPNRAVCEDVVHDIFLTLWTERARLQIGAFPAYLAAAARYQVAAYQRSTAAGDTRYADALDTLPAAADYNQGESQLLALDLENQVAAALRGLPQRCQEIFLLSRLQHFSNDEIAQRLHISRHSVENQLSLALRHLRLTLRSLGVLWLVLHLG